MEQVVKIDSELAQKKALSQVAKVLDEKIEEVMDGNVSKLSRESGVTTVTIANLRKGEINPSLGVLIKIFAALGVEISDVFKTATLFLVLAFFSDLMEWLQRIGGHMYG